MPLSGPYWTADEDATLKRLHAQGETYVEICKHIPGRTENACISRATKIGLGQRDRSDQALRALAARRGVWGRFVPVDQNRDAAD